MPLLNKIESTTEIEPSTEVTTSLNQLRNFSSQALEQPEVFLLHLNHFLNTVFDFYKNYHPHKLPTLFDELFKSISFTSEQITNIHLFLQTLKKQRSFFSQTLQGLANFETFISKKEEKQKKGTLKGLLPSSLIKKREALVEFETLLSNEDFQVATLLAHENLHSSILNEQQSSKNEQQSSKNVYLFSFIFTYLKELQKKTSEITALKNKKKDLQKEIQILETQKKSEPLEQLTKLRTIEAQIYAFPMVICNQANSYALAVCSSVLNNPEIDKVKLETLYLHHDTSTKEKWTALKDIHTKIYLHVKQVIQDFFSSDPNLDPFIQDESIIKMLSKLLSMADTHHLTKENFLDNAKSQLKSIVTQITEKLTEQLSNGKEADEIIRKKISANNKILTKLPKKIIETYESNIYLDIPSNVIKAWKDFCNSLKELFENPELFIVYQTYLLKEIKLFLDKNYEKDRYNLINALISKFPIEANVVDIAYNFHELLKRTYEMNTASNQDQSSPTLEQRAYSEAINSSLLPVILDFLPTPTSDTFEPIKIEEYPLKKLLDASLNIDELSNFIKVEIELMMKQGIEPELYREFYIKYYTDTLHLNINSTHPINIRYERIILAKLTAYTAASYQLMGKKFNFAQVLNEQKQATRLTADFLSFTFDTLNRNNPKPIRELDPYFIIFMRRVIYGVMLGSSAIEILNIANREFEQIPSFNTSDTSSFGQSYLAHLPVITEKFKTELAHFKATQSFEVLQQQFPLLLEEIAEEEKQEQQRLAQKQQKQQAKQQAIQDYLNQNSPNDNAEKEASSSLEQVSFDLDENATPEEIEQTFRNLIIQMISQGEKLNILDFYCDNPAVTQIWEKVCTEFQDEAVTIFELVEPKAEVTVPSRAPSTDLNKKVEKIDLNETISLTFNQEYDETNLPKLELEKIEKITNRIKLYLEDNLLKDDSITDKHAAILAFVKNFAASFIEQTKNPSPKTSPGSLSKSSSFALLKEGWNKISPVKPLPTKQSSDDLIFNKKVNSALNYAISQIIKSTKTLGTS